MLSKIKEAGRQVARSSSVSNDSRPDNLESQYHTSHIADKRRHSATVTDVVRTLQISPQSSKPKMDKRPPLRKRGSSLFNKMTSQETYESLVPRSTSSSRLSERTVTDNRDSGLALLSTRIKAHRMRKNSQLSLSLGPLEEHEIRSPGQNRAPPKLLRTNSVPDLLSRSQAMGPDSRTFCNGKPISNPFNFRHLSHMETRQTAQFEDTPEDILPLKWNSTVRESRAPKNPVIPLTPLTSRGVRRLQSLSGSLRTSGLSMPSPSLDSVYSPVDSMADLSMGSKSAESLTNTYPSHLAPPPRSSSRVAFTSAPSSRDDEVPILESEGRDSVIFLQDDLAILARTVGSIPEEELGLLDQEVEDDVLGAFPVPPVTSPRTLSLRTSEAQPNIAINNQLLPPLSPLRPSSSSSGTLGFGAVGNTDIPKDPSASGRSSNKMSKRMSRRVSILGDAQAEIQSWEADIDWTYDNNGLDGWVDDLEGIEEEEEANILLGSKSAPVSASPSTVNLVGLVSKRHSDEGTSFLAAPEEEITPRSPEIGVADGGFGIFDHADRQYNAFGHQRQLSKTRNGISHQRTLSTCASLPNLKVSRKHYRNSSLRGVSNLDNGIVTLEEVDEIQHLSCQRMHSAPPREVAIPPARYSGRSRAASNATCATLVSDIEGYPSDLSEMASTPSHSSHNSTEGAYFLSQAQDGILFDIKAQLGPSLHIINDEIPFNFF